MLPNRLPKLGRRTFLTTALAAGAVPNLATAAQSPPGQEAPTLSHLDSLRDTIQTPEGDELVYWWIYAEPVEEYSEQPPAGAEYDVTFEDGEGISCVDDVARIAVAYLNHYSQYGDSHSLERAREALEFIQYMQLEDGRFLNFITDPEKNEEIFGDEDLDEVDGIRVVDVHSSYPSTGWWAARAGWALGTGYTIFEDVDPAFAGELADAFHQLMDAWDDGPLSQYDEYDELHGRDAPKWVLGEGTDATSPAVLGLAEYVEQTGNDQAEAQLRKFADGLTAYQFGDNTSYPFNAHLPWTESLSMWHAWGSRQPAALARAGRVLGNEEFIRSAEAAANGLGTHLLASTTQLRGLFPSPQVFHQISYGANALAQGFVELWRATDDRRYSTLAGLMGSWYFGNNVADAEMYDPKTGRGFDGIHDTEVSWNAGAESTVCAVLTMLDLDPQPKSAQPLDQGTVLDSQTFDTVEAEASQNAVEGDATREEEGWTGEAEFSGGGYVELPNDGRLTIDPDVSSGEYLPYIAHRRQAIPNDAGTLTVETDEDAFEIDVGGADDPYLWLETGAPLSISSETELHLTYDGPEETAAEIDAITLQPLIEHRVVANHEGTSATAIARSFAEDDRTREIRVGLEGTFTIDTKVVDSNGEVATERSRVSRGRVETLEIPVKPQGYTLASFRSPSERQN